MTMLYSYSLKSYAFHMTLQETISRSFEISDEFGWFSNEVNFCFT